MTVQGADWAHWQGSVDIQGIYNKGCRFAILKSTDGTSYSYADSWFVPQMPRVLAVSGIIPGTYAMLIHGKDPVAQADYFGRYVAMFPEIRILALDFEFNEVTKTKPTDSECRSFAARVNALFPNKSKWLYGLEADVHRLKAYPEFATWVRWVARYSVTPPTGYDVWQYGAWEGLDGNRYPGTLDEFNALIGATGGDMALDAAKDLATFKKMLATCFATAEGAFPEIADNALGLGDALDGQPEAKARRKAIYDFLKSLGGGTAPAPADVDAVVAAIVARLQA
jgi:GH25 family lysozyme M1 (1,4-beta-N-acetylmuramidase)